LGAGDAFGLPVHQCDQLLEEARCLHDVAEGEAERLEWSDDLKHIGVDQHEIADRHGVAPDLGAGEQHGAAE